MGMPSPTTPNGRFLKASITGFFWAAVGGVIGDKGARSALHGLATNLMHSIVLQVAVGVWLALLVAGPVALFSRYRLETRFEQVPLSISVSLQPRQ